MTLSDVTGGLGQARVLAVGELFSRGTGESLPDGLICLGFEEVRAETVEAIGPDVILAPLVGQGFDCWDLAETLMDLGFRGKLRAVASEMPNPELVRREFAETFPELDFDLLLLDDPA